MVEITIKPLTGRNKYQALNIVLEADVGPKTRTLRFFNKSLRQKLNNIFLAIYKGTIVGLIGWYSDDGSWAGKSLGELFPYGKDIYWVSYFAVVDNLRDQGVGTQLMQKLLEEVKKKKARELWVYSQRARVFYEKMGFRFVTQARIEREIHNFLKYTFSGKSGR